MNIWTIDRVHRERYVLIEELRALFEQPYPGRLRWRARRRYRDEAGRLMDKITELNELEERLRHITEALG